MAPVPPYGWVCHYCHYQSYIPDPGPWPYEVHCLECHHFFCPECMYMDDGPDGDGSFVNPLIAEGGGRR